MFNRLAHHLILPSLGCFNVAGDAGCFTCGSAKVMSNRVDPPGRQTPALVDSAIQCAELLVLVTSLRRSFSSPLAVRRAHGGGRLVLGIFDSAPERAQRGGHAFHILLAGPRRRS